MKKVIRGFAVCLIMSALVLLVTAYTSGPNLNVLPENKFLLPASLNTPNGQKWGFIDEYAGFRINPEYDGVEEFNKAGIAVAYNLISKDKYYNDKNIFIINKSGKKLLGPIKSSKEIITDNNIIVLENGKYKFINNKGKIFNETNKEIDKYSEGMLPFSFKISDKSLYGFMNENGETVIPAKYSFADGFEGGRAGVYIGEGERTKALIDKKGNIIADPDMLIPFYDKTKYIYGYKNINGEVKIEPKLSRADEFEDGFAIVQLESTFKYALIDKNGNYIIKPDYSGIQSLGKGLYLVNKGIFTLGSRFTPGAIFNNQGKQISDFLYFDVNRFEGELASACDDTSTFFIDKNGKIVSTMPRIKGIGTMKIKDGIVIADVDGKRSYYKDGKLIWKQDNTVLLSDKIKVRKAIHRPDYCTFIEYPELEGLPDKSIQTMINQNLKKAFLEGREVSPKEGGQYTLNISVSFTPKKNKDLIIIEEGGYYYPVGAAHGQPIECYYHINCKTGEFYNLKELFKKDGKFTEKLASIISQQLSYNKKMKLEHPNFDFYNPSPTVNEERTYTIEKDYLNIIYHPYEIASFAAGSPEFHIPYGQILDIINTDGAYWKSFEKDIKNNVTTYYGSVDEGSVKAINDLMILYEKNMVEAINTNEFSKVEERLIKDSPLYIDQKKLVDSLSSQGIKEKFNSLDIYAIYHAENEKEYKVFAFEDISIKYAGKDFISKKFNWCYTVKDENGTFKLSKIDKWL